MKISPLSAGGIPMPSPEAPPSMGDRIRSVRMNTNVTPGREALEQDPKLTIPDPNEAQTADEATKPLSPQLALLAKEKRALQVRERAIEDREKALESRSTQGQGVDIARLKSDPLGVLLEAGVTYEQLTEAVLSSQDGSHTRALEAKIAALETSLDKKFTDRDTQQEQQALAEMRREALQLVAQGDTYELVRETKSVPHVIDLIERTYRKSGEVLDVREALQLIEDELLKDSLKLAGYSKVQSQLAPRPASPQPQRQMRTLTNRDTATVPLSAKARALAAFHGTLKR